MRISNLVTKNRMVLDLSETTKLEALSLLAKKMADSMEGASAKRILDIFLERERLGTTGVGQGISIPHGRYKGLSDPIAVLGRSFEGVPFEALDGKPVHLIVALLSPDGSSVPHLRALSAISRFLRSKQARDRLMSATDADELFQALSSGDES